MMDSQFPAIRESYISNGIDSPVDVRIGCLCLDWSILGEATDWLPLQLDYRSSDMFTSPLHIQQGRMGTCWIISPLQAIFKHPELATNVVRKTANSNGNMWSIRLCYLGKWTEVIVDAYMPMGSGSLHSVAIGNTQQLAWVSLIEKSFAKLKGSYESIHSGFVDDALRWLSGSPVFLSPLETADSDRKRGERWTSLKHSLSNGMLVAFNMKVGVFHSLVRLANLSNFLHSVCVLDAVEMQSGRCILKLANPWGCTFPSWVFSLSLTGWVGPPTQSDRISSDGSFFVDFFDVYEYIACIFTCRSDLISRDQWRFPLIHSQHNQSVTCFSVECSCELVVEVFTPDCTARDLHVLAYTADEQDSQCELESTFDSCLTATVPYTHCVVVPMSFFTEESVLNIALHSTSASDLKLRMIHVHRRKIDNLLSQICVHRGTVLVKSQQHETTIYRHSLYNGVFNLLCAVCESEKPITCQIGLDTDKTKLKGSVYFRQGNPPPYQTKKVLSPQSMEIVDVTFCTSLEFLHFLCELSFYDG